MAEPIVIQLQELASDSRHDAGDLLQKALLVASKLDLTDFREWVINELNGYKDPTGLPQYRIIRGDLRAQNPYHGLVPFIIPNAEVMEMVCAVHVTESLSSINHLLSDRSSGSICFFSRQKKKQLL